VFVSTAIFHPKMCALKKLGKQLETSTTAMVRRWLTVSQNPLSPDFRNPKNAHTRIQVASPPDRYLGSTSPEFNCVAFSSERCHKASPIPTRTLLSSHQVGASALYQIQSMSGRAATRLIGQ
jgi:hypothetical protein